MAGRTFQLQTPIKRHDIEPLALDDLIYLSGRILTLRDNAHQRIERYFQERKMGDIPFNLKELVVFHGSPVVRQVRPGEWQIMCAGATSSSRFSPRVKVLLEAMGPRAMVGKGTLTKEAIEVMKQYGAVYLQAVGGCAALYATRVKTVVANYWSELGMVDSVWELEVEDFGPLSVGIDYRGNCSYQRFREGTLRRNLLRAYEELGIDSQSDFVWWPRVAAGSKEAFEHATSANA